VSARPLEKVYLACLIQWLKGSVGEALFHPPATIQHRAIETFRFCVLTATMIPRWLLCKAMGHWVDAVSVASASVAVAFTAYHVDGSDG
jgi:hypothetical protein